MMKPGATGVDLGEFAKYMAEKGPRKTEGTSRRVRAIFKRTVVVDTTKALYVWEHDAYPQFYVPLKDMKDCALTVKHKIEHDGKTVAEVVELSVKASDGGAEAKTDRVVVFKDEKSLGALAGTVRLEFGSMDHWLEEDAPIYVHPKDPYKRIEILQSLRPIEVRVHGKTVAKSPTAMHLFETGLPTRFYLPVAAVDPAVLRKSDLITHCPYKGDAEYYDVVVDGKEAKNVVWYYRLPTQESAGVAGLLCFYNEKVDILLDGELLSRPQTLFS